MLFPPVVAQLNKIKFSLKRVAYQYFRYLNWINNDISRWDYVIQLKTPVSKLVLWKYTKWLYSYYFCVVCDIFIFLFANPDIYLNKDGMR